MNHSKLYVPDPNVWISFFKKSSQTKPVNQQGGNNMHSTKRSEEPMNVELISPVEAADERSQSTIKRLKKRNMHTHRARRKRINKIKTSQRSRKRKSSKSKRHRSAGKRKLKLRKKNRRDIFSN